MEKDVGKHERGVPVLVGADTLVQVEPIFCVNIVSSSEEMTPAGLRNDGQRSRRLPGWSRRDDHDAHYADSYEGSLCL